MKKYIGGFLELELFPQPGPGYHAGALALSNARACVSHIIGQTGMKRIWLPYYTCNALLEPFEQANIPYQFYGLTPELTAANLPAELAADEYLLYVNYFGLNNEYVRQLVSRYGNQLLVDNTQDFFARGYARGWGFNSARKSFGVPDGGYVYGPAARLGTADGYPVNADYHAGYLLDRLRGAQQQAYAGFVAYEHTLTSQPLRISEFSASLLSQVDFAAVIAKRRANFEYYHVRLGSSNTLSIKLTLSELPADTVPFCYPLLPASGRELDRRPLFAQNLFIPTLWPDVLTRQPTGYAWERRLTQAVLPLPVDHRYGPAELDKVIAAVRAQHS
ncbi:hypothetical protein [Hymenobacter algoricola]|uniref:DegT/DnrJ/EryC1/StrS aminotransferase family protein n=1 Tax=Hymenobacter algoricola TaxID=486267 RepID=A0ABP7NP83_9BACT